MTRLQSSQVFARDSIELSIQSIVAVADFHLRTVRLVIDQCCLVDNVLGLRIKWIFNFRRIKGFLHQNKLQVSVVLYLLMTLMLKFRTSPTYSVFFLDYRKNTVLLVAEKIER